MEDNSTIKRSMFSLKEDGFEVSVRYNKLMKDIIKEPSTCSLRLHRKIRKLVKDYLKTAAGIYDCIVINPEGLDKVTNREQLIDKFGSLYEAENYFNEQYIDNACIIKNASCAINCIIGSYICTLSSMFPDRSFFVVLSVDNGDHCVTRKRTTFTVKLYQLREGELYLDSIGDMNQPAICAVLKRQA